MRLPIFQVDAFTGVRARGNPAAVVILDEWLDDGVLQAIAEENNLSETAFVIPGRDVTPLRWFSPQVEVDLCGHATLAAAHVLFRGGYVRGEAVRFETRSGVLGARREGDLIELDLPSLPAHPVEATPELLEGLGATPREVHRATNLLALFDTEAHVRALSPRFDVLAGVDAFAVIATAPGIDSDFVSRFFAPGAGVPEDPVTGSAHCTLVPYWSRRLGKAGLHSRQVSARGGELFCEDRGDRVAVAGHVRDYLEGEISVSAISVPTAS